MPWGEYGTDSEVKPAWAIEEQPYSTREALYSLLIFLAAMGLSVVCGILIGHYVWV